MQDRRSARPKVHTAETTINGKTYVTETVETAYGTHTVTKEKKRKTAEEIHGENVRLLIFLGILAAMIFFFVYIIFLK